MRAPAALCPAAVGLQMRACTYVPVEHPLARCWRSQPLRLMVSSSSWRRLDGAVVPEPLFALGKPLDDPVFVARVGSRARVDG